MVYARAVFNTHIYVYTLLYLQLYNISRRAFNGTWATNIDRARSIIIYDTAKLSLTFICVPTKELLGGRHVCVRSPEV